MARKRKRPGSEAINFDHAARPELGQREKQEKRNVQAAETSCNNLPQHTQSYRTTDATTTDGTLDKTKNRLLEFKRSRKLKKRRRRRLAESAAKRSLDSETVHPVQHCNTASVAQFTLQSASVALRSAFRLPQIQPPSVLCTETRTQAAADHYGLRQARHLARMGARTAQTAGQASQEPLTPEHVSSASAPRLDEAAADRYGLQQARHLALAGARRSQALTETPVSMAPSSNDSPSSDVAHSKNPATVPGYELDIRGDCDLLRVPRRIFDIRKYVRIGEGFVLGRQAKVFPPDLENTGAGDNEESAESTISQPISKFEEHFIHDIALDSALSEEQRRLVNLILDGRNIFYTGSAGTGKSTVLREFVSALELQGKQVVKVAPTGVAALNIHGQTYYRFAGWNKNSRKRSVSQLKREACNQYQRWERLNEVDVLVIDEISMLDAHQMDRLDSICRAARKPAERHETWRHYYGDQATSPHDSQLPFGGIQIIVTGDFCQLPPVAPFKTCFPCGKTTQDIGRGISRCEPCDNTFRTGDEWAFKSHAWQACDFTNVQLTQVHRQTDADFVAILEKLRAGQCPSPQQLDLLLNHPSETDGAIRLFPRNAEASAENANRLKEIPLQAFKYGCIDNTWHDAGAKTRSHVPSQSSFSPMLALKVGMLVMHLVNGPFQSGIVNGSQGRIVDFRPYDPAQLHESAKNGTDRLPPVVGDHAAYRSTLIREWLHRIPVKVLPYVEFFSGQRALIFPVCDVDEIGDEKPYTLRSRTQLPLAPAWAISIHKSQGMRLDRVSIDIDHAFKSEMPYVALSRARSLHGLELQSSNGLAAIRGVCRNPHVDKFLEACFGQKR
ncbi:unnamed protein product [Zymoseptoria tritici ST99CH_1A5]|uniref:ATP-dependent DNA helicase n=3 Tax=Zymoseptoria tritici TaxID=1047171 RepID=A0A1X7RZ14_ZYMT9|nr:unnamed protein product [Zymoseptoria tritici ST99CH_3D7]SMR55493.1 unnamed protein product [Zymoseptoria tritici ST99CH_1E4]SMR57867.1 unnamed protein product [Zymoseptoria tritici ST99CH_3D1]SMY26303.1 unnamed protein product [Zymoseptoria tritici ST99CH_1A5]